MPASKKKKKYIAISAFTVVLLIILFFVLLSSEHAPVSPSVAPKIAPTTPYYLPYPAPGKGNSSILLVFASSSYGHYPFTSVPQRGDQPGVQKGEPCLIITVTVRNGYSSENPLPTQEDLEGANGTIVSMYLTAQVFNQQGLINATDVTPPYPPVPYPGAYIGLDSGQTATLTIYLATNHTDLTHFEIVPEYIGAIPPP